MKVLNQKELLYLKKNYFTPTQKTLCKKFEQTSGQFTFPAGNPIYKFQHDGSKAYSDYVFTQQSQNTGFMHKGNNVRKQDSYGKVNYTEKNIIKKIDKKNKNGK